MRKSTGSIMMYLMLGGIIVVFAVNFGPGSGSCSGGDPNYAAVVDGDVIRQQDFAQVYSRRVDQMRRTYTRGGGTLSNELLEKLGLRKQVIDGLIDKKLLAHEATRRGLAVSDPELLDYLAANYGVGDEITADQYESWVNNVLRMQVWRFEEDVRAEILGGKIAGVVTDVLSVSDSELKEQYMREHNRAMVSFVKFSANPGKVAAPPADAVAKLIADDMPAIESRYTRDVLKYRTPRQVKTRQILRKLASDASAADVAAAKQLLVDLKAKVAAGADFAELAKEHSEDTATAAKGGTMGTFGRGEMLKVLEDAVFGLSVGELVAEPVKTRLGLHLIQVEEVKEPQERGLDEVKEEVARTILADQAADVAAQAEAGAFLAQLASGKTFEDLSVTEDEARAAGAAPAGLVRKDTPWILESDSSVPRIGASEELHAAIFELTKEKPVATKAVKVGKAFFVVSLKDREVPDMQGFAATKENLRSQALAVKRDKVFRDWLKYLRKQAKVSLNPAIFGDGTA